MKNTIKQYNNAQFDFKTASGLSEYIKKAGQNFVRADEAFSVAAPYALYYATAEKDSNLDPVNQLFLAMALKTDGENLSANQKKLITFIELYAPFLRFDGETAKLKPIKLKKAGRDRKTGKTKYIPVDKRVLSENFEFSLDFRTCKKAETEKAETEKPLTLKQAKSFIDKQLSGYAKKTQTMAQKLDAIVTETVEDKTKQEESKIDLYTTLLDMVFSTVPAHLIAARLEAETGTVVGEPETVEQKPTGNGRIIPSESEKLDGLRGDQDAKQA